MVTINTNKQAGEYEFKGLSTDTKPTENVSANSMFLELDTCDVYYFNGTTWEKVEAGSGSSEITIPVPINQGGTNASIASEALANLGAVPTTRTVNNKALSSDITLTASDVGAAASNHTHTAADVGAVPATRTINSKALSSDVTLSASDIGAAESSHNHSVSDITSGTLPISRGGTNATTASAALTSLGAVPTTRTVNNKALSSDITLSASDVSAASTSDVGNVSNLSTTAKTAVGAINELYSTIDSISDGEIFSSKISLFMGTYVGNGNASRSITLSNSPDLLFLFRIGVPFTSYDSTNNYIICSSAVATSSSGVTGGVTLSGNALTVEQGEKTNSTIGTYLVDLNRASDQYMYIAFRKISE